MKLRLKKVGMRNIKTAIAVTLCVIISKLLKLESVFYVAIAAVISMQNSVYSSFNAGKNRMLGTFVGAVVGFICASIAPGNALICGIGIIIVIYICDMFKWNKSISIGGIVFLAIMVNLKDTTPLYYSIYRLVDTFIGITVALIVNYFMFPPNLKKHLKNNFEKLKSQLFNTSYNIFDNNLSKVDLLSLDKLCSELELNLKEYLSEVKIKKEEEFSHINNLINYYKKLKVHLSILVNFSDIDYLYEGNQILFEKVFSETKNISTPCCNSHREIIYNYHAKETLNLLYQIQCSIN